MYKRVQLQKNWTRENYQYDNKEKCARYVANAE